MMRIRLDINGRDIGEIGVWNRQEFDVEEGTIRYSVYDLRGFTGDHIEDAPHLFDVWYDGDAGAASLTARVMDELSEDRLVDEPRRDV